MIGNIVAGLTFSPVTLSYKDTVLLDNPIGFWLLDETSGTTADDLTANNNNADYINTPSLNQAGNGGGILKSVFFDGSTTEYARTAELGTYNLAPNGNWSMECWYKDNTAASTTLEAVYTIRSDSGGTPTLLNVFAINNGTAGKIEAFLSNSDGSGVIVLSYSPTADTNWHHLVLTATSGGAARLYVDGVERASSTTARASSTANRRVTINSNQAADGGPFTPTQLGTMNIAGVSVYNTALSAAQVTAHYNAGA